MGLGLETATLDDLDDGPCRVGDFVRLDQLVQLGEHDVFVALSIGDAPHLEIRTDKDGRATKARQTCGSRMSRREGG